MANEAEIYTNLTDAEKAKMWYIIALQALHELGRPLLLSETFADKVTSGEKSIFATRTDDGGYLYEVI